MKKFLLAVALLGLGYSTAVAADMRVNDRPPVAAAPTPRAAEDKCVWNEVGVFSADRSVYPQKVAFKVTFRGAQFPGGQVTMPVHAEPGAKAICLPRAAWDALGENDLVEICLGTFSKTIRNSEKGNWMTRAKANVARTGVTFPGEPMVFINKGGNGRQPPYANGVHTGNNSPINSIMRTGTAIAVAGIHPAPRPVYVRTRYGVRMVYR